MVTLGAMGAVQGKPIWLLYCMPLPPSPSTFISSFNVKVKVISFYSGGTNECCQCGCDNIKKLEINHIEGGGTEHREKLFGSNTGGVKFYQWLIKNGFPSGYDVRCKICNLKYRPEKEEPVTQINMEDF